MKIDSREVVKDLLQGTAPPRPLFLPIVFSLGARIENLPLQSFLTNPTKITNALRKIRSHLRSDGVSCYFDSFLELEAMGATLDWQSSDKLSVRWPTNPDCGELPDGLRSPEELRKSGRVPVAVEVIRRLKSLLRDEPLLMAAISGPFTLAARLLQVDPSAALEARVSSNALELASAAIASISTAFLEAGANIIFIREEMFPAVDHLSDWTPLLATTINIVRFYGAIPVLLLVTYSKNLEPILQQPPDCIVCLELEGNTPEQCDAFENLAPAKLGIAIPMNANMPSAEDSANYEQDLRNCISRFHPAIVTTAGDIPVTTDLKRLNVLREIVIA